MKIVKNWGLPILSIILTCLFPCAFMYFQNAGEARLTDMLPMLGLYLISGLAAFLILLLILRNGGRAAILTDLGMLVVINFNLISEGIKLLIPGFRSVFLLILAGASLVGLLVILFRKKPDMTVLCGLVCLAFGVMILMNGIMAIPAMISTVTYETPVMEAAQTETPARVMESVQLQEAQASADIQPQAAPPVTHPADCLFREEKRNVYFFLFDEYGGSENLKHYFDFDNEEFLTELERKGFSVSRTSRNPESPWTVTLIPNIMNLDYVTSDEEEIRNRLTWLENPALYQMFRNNGYRIELINHEGFLGEQGCHVVARGRREENISDVIFENGVLSQIPGVDRFVEQDVLKKGSDEYRALMEVSRELIKCGSRPKEEPTLTVGYFVMPHAPFAADERGEPAPREKYYEWRENEPYIGMLKYTNGVILEAVENIQEHDPDALILMMADHGARKPGHIYNQYGGPSFDADEEIPYMMNVLCTVYDPRNKVDVEGDTCINAVRKTFDAAFGLELGILETPPDYELSADDIIKDMGKGH